MNKKISSRLTMVALLSMAALLLTVSTVEAKSKKKNNKAAIVNVEGTLQVVKNEKNRIAAIKIDDRTGETYNIIINKKSKKKAKKFDGKAVMLSFKLDKKLSEEKNENWVKLVKIKLLQEDAEEVSEEME